MFFYALIWSIWIKYSEILEKIQKCCEKLSFHYIQKRKFVI